MEKIKQFVNLVQQGLQSEKGKDILVIIIVILVGLGSFELGRLSKENSAASGLKIEYPNQTEEQTTSLVLPEKNFSTASPSDKNFFASSRGTKYYSIGCSAGKTIKQANRIYFATREEAETAGYELSSACH